MKAHKIDTNSLGLPDYIETLEAAYAGEPPLVVRLWFNVAGSQGKPRYFWSVTEVTDNDPHTISDDDLWSWSTYPETVRSLCSFLAYYAEWKGLEQTGHSDVTNVDGDSISRELWEFCYQHKETLDMNSTESELTTYRV